MQQSAASREFLIMLQGIVLVSAQQSSANAEGRHYHMYMTASYLNNSHLH